MIQWRFTRSPRWTTELGLVGPSKYSLSFHSWKCKHILGGPKIALNMVYSAAFVIRGRAAFTHWLYFWAAVGKANFCRPSHHKLQQELAIGRKILLQSKRSLIQTEVFFKVCAWGQEASSGGEGILISFCPQIHAWCSGSPKALSNRHGFHSENNDNGKYSFLSLYIESVCDHIMECVI